MIKRTNTVAILSLLMVVGVSVLAQNPQPTPRTTTKSAASTRTKPTEGKITPPRGITNLQGFGVTGRIPKFGGGDYLVNSLIFESVAGKIGIGTQTPGSTLSVNGQIETIAGGVKFPDGSVQVTAGVAPVDVVKTLNGLKGTLSLNAGTNIAITPSGNTVTVSAPNALTATAHDATLTGNGTTLSPLSVVSAESQQEPFYAYHSKSFGEGDYAGGAAMELTTVPADKRLIIEHISGICIVPIGERVVELKLSFEAPPGFPQVHYLIPSYTGANPLLGDRYVWSQSVRLIVDSGLRVRLLAIKFPKPLAGVSVCEGTIAGYLVNKP